MNDLEGWRKRIDEIDQQILKLLNERSRCAVEIGHIKKAAEPPGLASGTRDANSPQCGKGECRTSRRRRHPPVIRAHY